MEIVLLHSRQEVPLQARVLEGAAPVTDRPADHIAPEMAKIEAEVASPSERQFCPRDG